MVLWIHSIVEVTDAMCLLSFLLKEADAVPALDNVDQIVDVFYHLDPEQEEKPGNFFAR